MTLPLDSNLPMSIEDYRERMMFAYKDLAYALRKIDDSFDKIEKDDTRIAIKSTYEEVICTMNQLDLVLHKYDDVLYLLQRYIEEYERPTFF